MRALLLDRLGGAENLRLAEIAVPEPGPGEVRIRVHAAGLNPADYKILERGAPGWRFPVTAGLDPAGTIDAVGPDAGTWQIGERVFSKASFARLGAFADYFVGPAHVVGRLPPPLSFVEAAALPTAGITAYQILHRRLRVTAGETVVILGAAGGVGGFLVQLAKVAGLRVIGTASRRNVEFVRSLGADHVIDYQAEDVVSLVRQITDKRGAEFIVDTVGPDSAATALGLLAHNGALACVAGTPPLTSFPRAISIHDIGLGFAFVSGDRRAQADIAAMGETLAAHVAAGRLDPMVSETIALGEVPSALMRLAQRHVRGKIVAKLV